MMTIRKRSPLRSREATTGGPVFRFGFARCWFVRPHARPARRRTIDVDWCALTFPGRLRSRKPSGRTSTGRRISEPAGAVRSRRRPEAFAAPRTLPRCCFRSSPALSHSVLLDIATEPVARMDIAINGIAAGTCTFRGRDRCDVALPEASVRPGVNALTIANPSDRRTFGPGRDDDSRDSSAVAKNRTRVDVRQSPRSAIVLPSPLQPRSAVVTVARHGVRGGSADAFRHISPHHPKL